MKAANILIVLVGLNLSANAQSQEVMWEAGGGLRLSYLGLSGGMSAFRASDGYEFNLDYKDIGMDNYSSSLSLVLGGRIKKWNLMFNASRGSWAGAFTFL